MKKLYEKSELWFTLLFIIIYSVGQSYAVSLNKVIGVDYAANMVLNIALTVVLFTFIRRNGLMRRYGLCKSPVPARSFLWYLPLVVLASFNLWNGFTINLPPAAMACYLVYMLCVGFVEEILFRGLLFKAIEKDGVKTAIIISSVTFALGHLINLVNGVNTDLVDGLCQVALAIPIGFLFVILFYRGGSLWPCIVTHSAIDMISSVSNLGAATLGQKMLIRAIIFAFIVLYTLILMKTLPKKQPSDAEALTR